MPSTLVLDTHALLWFLQGDARLGAAAKSAINDSEAILIIPAIVLAEALWIVERGRTNIPSPTLLGQAIDGDRRFKVIALDRAIGDKTIPLTKITEMDDRQIVATALSLATPQMSAALVTIDAQIVGSNLVQTLW